jgi:hypothetical protein
MDLKAEKRSLKSLLAVDEQQFRIPPYQRPYAWTSEQIDDLWDDLVDNLGGGHFLGSLVLASEDETRPSVIDGQQRLTTLMLLLSAIRDEAQARSLTGLVAKIDKRMLADDLAGGDDRFKFKTGAANWPVFRDLVLRGPTDPQRKRLADFEKSVQAHNRALLDNLATLRKRLADKLASIPEGDRSAWLEKFNQFVLQKVELVVVEVRSLADAFLLFETLNDRGLQLSAADLLKSHLLGEIAKHAGDEDVDAASASWDAMLEELGAQVDVSRFLRHYLLSRYPKVEKDKVFGFFKELVAERGATPILQDLKIAAGYYGEFEAPQKVTHDATRYVLGELQTLRAATCYIALLPARRYLSEVDFVEYARLAEVLTFRYSSVAGRGTNELERRYHDAAKILIESKGARLADSRAVLVAAMPDGAEFESAFQRLTMGRQYLLRYTLAKIEQSLSTGAEKQLKTSDLVHIEHVMPKTLSTPWRDALGDDVDRHDEYVNRWGNLTLFYAGYNIPASNKTFEMKKPYFEKSDVELTKRLCSYDTWGPEQIDDRQRWLGHVAEQLWRVPDGGSALSSGTPDGADTVDRFRQQLGDLWDTVCPLCVETSTEEIKQLAERLPDHLELLVENRQLASQLSGLLTELLGRWETYDVAQRSVVRAATAYFLQRDDVIPDNSVGGLVDDDSVVRAAQAVLA